MKDAEGVRVVEVLDRLLVSAGHSDECMDFPCRLNLPDLWPADPFITKMRYDPMAVQDLCQLLRAM